MKYLQIKSVYLILLIVGAIVFSSCKKDNTTISGEKYPTPISNLVPQSMIDSLRARGANIYSGTTPPIVNGIYLMTPDSCTYDNSPSNFAGNIFTDYKFRFSAQDNTAYTITVEQKASPAGTLNAAPAYTYISGSGNNFTIFILRTQSAQGIPGQIFNVFSGTLTANGIQKFQNSLYIRSKGSDPNNQLASAGTIRVFINGAPGLAANSSTF